MRGFSARGVVPSFRPRLLAHVICYSSYLLIGVRGRPRVRVFRTEHALFGSEGDNF